MLHEVRALTLFALGKYKEAAASLNSLLASSPGMDWTSMSSLYGNADDYTQQLRKLEAHIKANRNDAGGDLRAGLPLPGRSARTTPRSARCAKSSACSRRTRRPSECSPRWRRRLRSPWNPRRARTPPRAAPQPDLVGTWKTTAGDTAIELTIDDQFQFTWKATPKGKPPVELKGTVNTDGDTLALENEKQGSMVGQVKSGGPDKFTFALQGSPPEAGLAFARAG